MKVNKIYRTDDLREFETLKEALTYAKNTDDCTSITQYVFKEGRTKVSEVWSKDRIDESKKLDEGTSNFGWVDPLPLLVFYTYDEILSQMDYASDKPHEDDFEDEYGNVDYEAYEAAMEEFENKYWDNVDIAVLDESDIDDLNDDLTQLNDDLKNLAYDLCDRAQYPEDEGLSQEEADHLYEQSEYLEDVATFSVEPGYYSAAYISCKNPKSIDELDEDERKLIFDRIDEIKSKYGLTKLGIAWGPASNGETGYKKVEALGKAKHFDAKCPYCGSEDYDVVDSDVDSTKYICADCGEDFIVWEDDDTVTDRHNRPIKEEIEGTPKASDYEDTKKKHAKSQKKGARGSFERFCGDPEKEADAFNHMMGSDTASEGCGEGSACAEALDSSLPSKKDIRNKIDAYEDVLDEIDTEDEDDVDENYLNQIVLDLLDRYDLEAYSKEWDKKYEEIAKLVKAEIRAMGIDVALSESMNEGAEGKKEPGFEYVIYKEDEDAEKAPIVAIRSTRTEAEYYCRTKDLECSYERTPKGKFKVGDDFWGPFDSNFDLMEGVSPDNKYLKKAIAYLNRYPDAYAYICSYKNPKTHEEVGVAKGFKTRKEFVDYVSELLEFTDSRDISTLFQTNKNMYIDYLKESDDSHFKHYSDEVAELGVSDEEAARIIKVADDYEKTASRGVISYEEMDKVADELGLKSMSDDELSRMWEVCYAVLNKESFKDDNLDNWRKYSDAASAFSEVINREARERKATGGDAKKEEEHFDLNELIAQEDIFIDTDGLVYLTSEALKRVAESAKRNGMSLKDLTSMRFDASKGGKHGSLLLSEYEGELKRFFESAKDESLKGGNN